MRGGAKSGLKRAESVIEGDRLGVASGAIGMISRDVGAVMAEYFLLDGAPEVAVEKTADGYSVTVKATCRAIRAFGSARPD